MRVTSRGQVTIPQDIRERYGFLPHTEVEFVEEAGAVVLHKGKGSNRQAREWLRRSRGTADAGMTSDEIMALTRGED